MPLFSIFKQELFEYVINKACRSRNKEHLLFFSFMIKDLKNIVESLLFVAGEPLSIDRFKSIIPKTGARDIKEALSVLGEEYDARKGGFFLRAVAGGYQVRTRPEYTEWVKRLAQNHSSSISRAALETLAIIAYKQPIIRSEIEHIRGVDCGGLLRILIEKKLARVLGRKEIPGRPLIYGTTKEFLEVFDLATLKDLPVPEEIQEKRAPDSDKVPDKNS
ncbi:SMC-Scp complex subunit ScpB [Desulfosarcina sp. BuS5]|uniref:SMC-Scp complex subunit ScpB n=1 Tax=Desulfosarcina sp. BuS5 TaxID=933262 RepID=UPI0018DE763E|nr:SMC-Scp complex subunit ScpB [Desulfosarcina sp. BuS5]